MWFSGAAAKRLAGRSADLAAHMRMHAHREAERRQQRQLDDDRRQQNQREAEAASARVAQRKEKDRERAMGADGRNVHLALWRSRDDMDQWAVDASSLRPPAHMRTASDMTLPNPLLGHGSPPASQQLISTVVRIVRRADTASFLTLFSSLPPSTCSLLSNLRNRSGDSLLHLCAASSPHTAILQQLIRCRADVNALNGHRDSPLHLACAARHNKAIKALLLAGADVEISNRDEKLCWEMPDTTGRNKRSGSEDDGQRRLRAFVQLLLSERNADILAAEKQDRQHASDQVTQLWSNRFYRRQQAAERRRGREWSERQAGQRSGNQSVSGSNSSGSQSPAAIDAAGSGSGSGWFHEFAEQALSDCEGLEARQLTTTRARRSSSRSEQMDELGSDHWLYRSTEQAGSEEKQQLRTDDQHPTQRPRTAATAPRSASRPQSAHSTQSLPVLLAQPINGSWHHTHAQLHTLNVASPRTRHQLAHRPQSRQAQRPQTAPTQHRQLHTHSREHVPQRPTAADGSHDSATTEQPLLIGQQQQQQVDGGHSVAVVRRSSVVARGVSRRLLDSAQPPDAYKDRRLRSFLY